MALSCSEARIYHSCLAHIQPQPPLPLSKLDLCTEGHPQLHTTAQPVPKNSESLPLSSSTHGYNPHQLCCHSQHQQLIWIPVREPKGGDEVTCDLYSTVQISTHIRLRHQWESEHLEPKQFPTTPGRQRPCSQNTARCVKLSENPAACEVKTIRPVFPFPRPHFCAFQGSRAPKKTPAMSAGGHKPCDHTGM